MDSKQVMGARLKKARIALGMTQATLAEKAEMTQDWISSIEHGRRRPDLCTILHLAEALQMSLDEIVGNGKVNHKKKPKTKGKSNGKD